MCSLTTLDTVNSPRRSVAAKSAQKDTCLVRSQWFCSYNALVHVQASLIRCWMTKGVVMAALGTAEWAAAGRTLPSVSCVNKQH